VYTKAIELNKIIRAKHQDCLQRETTRSLLNNGVHLPFVTLNI